MKQDRLNVCSQEPGENSSNKTKIEQFHGVQEEVEAS